jgi:hypothetical protein
VSLGPRTVTALVAVALAALVAVAIATRRDPGDEVPGHTATPSGPAPSDGTAGTGTGPSDLGGTIAGSGGATGRGTGTGTGMGPGGAETYGPAVDRSTPMDRGSSAP